jgi:hypothetical protein
MRPRPFTVAEANALIPVLEAVFARVDRWKEEAQRHHDRLQVLELLWGDGLEDPSNPDHEEAELERARIALLVREIQGEVQREILARGLRFPPGGLSHGLVDFPTTWQGRWILLCWRRGEPELVAWHDLNGGFAGRQPLTEEQRTGMGSGPEPAGPGDPWPGP